MRDCGVRTGSAQAPPRDVGRHVSLAFPRMSPVHAARRRHTSPRKLFKTPPSLSGGHGAGVRPQWVAKPTSDGLTRGDEFPTLGL